MTDSHLELDDLADVLAGGPEPPHLQSCATCRARLDELGTATTTVSAALAALPVPDLPADLDERLARAVAQAGSPAPTNVLPLVSGERSRQRTRWLAGLGAVAAAAAVVVGAVVLTNRGGSSPTRTADTASGGGYAVNDTGADYTAAKLAAALPRLLTGTSTQNLSLPKAAAGAQGPAPVPTQERASDTTAFGAAKPAVADPLAALRDQTGLARCLASLTDPSESGVPLALDYASYQGTPALVVVLPSSKPDKVDVFVVPAGCAQADGQVLYFTRLPKP